MTQDTQFVKNVGKIGFTQAATALKGFLLLPFLTKLLGPETYGIWSQIIVTISFLLPFVLLGLPTAILRFLPATPSRKELQQQVWSLVLFVGAIGFFVAILLFILAPQVEALTQIPKLFVFLIGFILICKTLNTVFQTILRAFEKITAFSFFVLFIELGEVVFAITLLLLGYQLIGAISAIIAIQVIALGLLFSVTVKSIGFSSPDFSYLKQQLQFSIPTVGSSVAFWTVQVSDRYIIGAFLGVLYVGYYAPAYAFGNMLNLLILPITLLLPATLAKLFTHKNIHQIQSYLSSSLKYALLLLIPATFGISMLAKPLLLIFSTQEIASHSFYIIPFVALSFLLYGVYAIFSQILKLYKKTYIGGIIWIAAALLNIVLNLALIPHFGILAAAITTLFSFAIATILTFLYTKRYLRFSIDYKTLSKSIGASLVMSFGVWLLHPNDIFSTITAIIFGAVIYVFLLIVMRALTKQELLFLKSLVKK